MIIPPRYAAPLLAVDSVEVAGDDGATVIEARKVVDDAEPALRGHFPGFAIYPGVFLIETFHQAVVAGLARPGRPSPRLLHLDSVRFLAPFVPGDEIRLEIRITMSDVDGQVVRSARGVCHRSAPGDASSVVAARVSARYGDGELAHA